MVDRLVVALNTGDLQGLMDILAPDVVSVADSGGKVRGAARRPGWAADRLARYLVGGMPKAGGAVPRGDRVNGQAAVRMELDGQLVGIASITVEHGRVTKVYSIANPDKLGRLDEQHGARRWIRRLAYSWSSRTGPGSMYHSTNERARASCADVITQRLAYTRSSSG